MPIPQGFGEWQFVIPRGSGKLKPIAQVNPKPRFWVRGNFGEYFVSDLKSIQNFSLLKIFF
jgi:hypothetical protein